MAIGLALNLPLRWSKPMAISGIWHGVFVMPKRFWSVPNPLSAASGSKFYVSHSDCVLGTLHVTVSRQDYANRIEILDILSWRLHHTVRRFFRIVNR